MAYGNPNSTESNQDANNSDAGGNGFGGSSDSLAQLQPDEEAPTSRFRDAGSANEWAVDRFNADLWGQYDRSLVDEMNDGSPPMSQADLRNSGNGNDFNINFQRAFAQEEQALAAYNDLANGDEMLISCEVDYKGSAQERDEWARIYCEGFTRLHRFYWPNFVPNLQLLSKFFIRHGVAIAFRGNEWDWRWSVSRLGDFQISRRDGCAVDDLECAVQRKFLPPPDVLQWVANKEIAKSVGWDVEATRKAVQQATITTGQDANGMNWEQVQRDSKDNGLWMTKGKDPRVEIRDFWVKEFPNEDGECKVSHYITSPSNNENFLFKKIGRWSSPTECFSKDTLVRLKGGNVPIGSLSGKVVEVQCRDGEFRPATFSSYGEKEIWEVILANGSVIRTTQNHRWITGWNFQECTTENLEGKNIPIIPSTSRPEKNEDYRLGVEHGIVYGDGSKAWGDSSFRVALYGSKKALIKYLPDRKYTVCRDERVSDPEFYNVSIPNRSDLKSPPTPEHSDSYWYGFWSGFISTDGCVDPNGKVSFSSVNWAESEYIAKQAERFGIVASKTHHVCGDGYGKRTDNTIVHFFKKTIIEDDLLLPKHKQNFISSSHGKRIPTIKVVSVKRTGVIEETFCCEQPETKTFVLGNGLLTGNCMTFFTYGIGNGDFYSIRGLGYKIFAMEQMFNILMSRLGDSTLRSMSYLWQPQSADAALDANQIIWGSDTLVPQGIAPIQQFAQNVGQNAIPLINLLNNIESMNTGTYSASQQLIQGGRPDRESATRAAIDAQKEAVLTSSAKILFMLSLDRNYSMTSKALTRRDYPITMPGGKDRWRLFRYCLDRGMPEEAFYNIECVRAVRPIGMGSPAEQQAKLQATMAIFPMLDQMAQQILLRKMVNSNLGLDYGKLLVPQEPRIPQDKKTAELEANSFINGIIPEILSGEDDLVHLEEHFSFGAETLAALEQQQMPPQAALSRLIPCIEHSAAHAERLAQNPTKKKESNEINQMLQRFQSQIQKISQNLAQEQQAAQEAAQREQQALDAETLKQQREDLKVQSEIRRKQLEAEAFIEMEQVKTEASVRATEAKTAADVAGKMQLTATEISTKGAKTKADIVAKDVTTAQKLQDSAKKSKRTP